MRQWWWQAAARKMKVSEKCKLRWRWEDAGHDPVVAAAVASEETDDIRQDVTEAQLSRVLLAEYGPLLNKIESSFKRNERHLSYLAQTCM